MRAIKSLAEEVPRRISNALPKLLETVVSKLTLTVDTMLEKQTLNPMTLANMLTKR